MTTYQEDRYWSDVVMQPIAMRDYYAAMWPDCNIHELDKGKPGSLEHLLDIAGADKLIRFRNGQAAFLGQRFRRNDLRRYDDFTIRYTRESGMKTEYEKIAASVQNKSFTAGYYAYGLANENNTGFERMRIIDFAAFIRRYIQNLIPPPQVRPNNDTPRTWFAFWPFDRLEQFIIKEWINPPLRPIPYKWDGVSVSGQCRLSSNGHDCYHHPKDKSKLVCRNCGEFVEQP